jgi:glycogen operon protein
MVAKDWYDADLHTVGMFVSGDPLRSPGPRGEQQHDCSFLMWFNGGPEAVALTLPRNQWVNHGEVVLSTDPHIAVGAPVASGDDLTLAGRSVLVLRQTDHSR